jgi:hypothetical protein
MADTKSKTEDKTPEDEEPDLGTVIGTGLLELARTGRLSEPTTAALSDAFDPKPEPTEADTKAADEARLTDADRAELTELRAARDKAAAADDKASSTTKGGSK